MEVSIVLERQLLNGLYFSALQNQTIRILKVMRLNLYIELGLWWSFVKIWNSLYILVNIYVYDF